MDNLNTASSHIREMAATVAVVGLTVAWHTMTSAVWT